MRSRSDAFLAASPAASRDRTDGRERVAVPLVPGLVAALASSAIGIAAAFVAVLVLTLGAILVLGNVPSTESGHPLLGLTELIFYASAGAFGWSRLRRFRPHALRALSGRDLRVLAIGVVALVVAQILLNWQLAIVHQSGHVQSGFERFDVVTHSATATAFGIIFTVLSMVVVGPLVEEIVFRGLLFGALASKLGVVASALISALVFGALHGDPVLFLWLAAVAIVNAFCYAATGNLTVAVILHALTNAVGATILTESSLHGH